jgi:hypothetical protein
VVLLTTLETNRDAGYSEFSNAPSPSERYRQFLDLDYPRKVVTVEPIMDFDLETFTEWIFKLEPEYVWLGYNSRPRQVQLPEPSTGKFRELVRILELAGIPVRLKEVRHPLNPVPSRSKHAGTGGRLSSQQLSNQLRGEYE